MKWKFIINEDIQEYIWLMLICLVSIIFFVKIYPIAFVVHDDISMWAIVRNDELVSFALRSAKGGRISHFIYQILIGIPMLANSFLAYKILTYACITYCVISFFIVVRKNCGKQISYLSVILFFSMAVISDHHSLFISYVLGHTIEIGLIFNAIYFLQNGMERKKDWFLFASAVFFLGSIILSEGMITFIAAFFLIAKIQYKNFFDTIKVLKYHFVLSLLYCCVYFWWRSIYPSSYDGVALTFTDISGTLTALSRYTLGACPLAEVLGICARTGDFSLLKWISFDVILVSVLASFAFYKIIPTCRWTSNLSKILAISFISMFLPNIVMSFTEKYIAWARNGEYSYLTSFECWFFMIWSAVLMSVYLTNRFPKKIIISSLTALVFLVCILTGVGNNRWSDHLEKKLQKYYAFDEALRSDEVKELPDGSYIYIPDYKGINHTMDQTQYYSKIYTNKTFVFTNEESQIDYEKEGIIFRYDEEKGKIVMEHFPDKYK